MAFTRAWDENDPGDLDAARYGAQEIRELKTDIRERLGVEHLATASDNPGGDTGIHLFNTKWVGADYNVAWGDSILAVDASSGNVTVTFPTPDPSMEGRVVSAIKLDSTSNTVTVRTPKAGGGYTDYVLAREKQAIILYSASSEWRILAGDMVDGYHASLTPTAYTIPVSGSDGKLSSGWIPATELLTFHGVGVFDLGGYNLDSGWTVLWLTYQEVDPLGEWNTSLRRFTPTVAGYYVFNVGVSVQCSSGSDAYASIALRKNGSTFFPNTQYPMVHTPADSKVRFVGLHYILHLETSDYVEVVGRANVGSTISVQSASLNIHKAGV